MPRTPRRLLVDLGSTNHCTWRSHNYSRVLEEDDAKRFFLALLQKYAPRHGILVRSYCLMGTHPHVVVAATRGPGLVAALLVGFCAAKALAHWLAAGLPLILATPVLGLLLNLDISATAAVTLTLLAGTPALTFTGMIGASLAVTLHRGGLLLAVLVLPLSIPVLIFGVAASEAAITGSLSFGAPFSILCALSLFGLVIGPYAAAASLRHGLD